MAKGRVENMRAYIIDNGRNENDLACLIATPFPLTWHDRTPKAEWVECPVLCILVEHPMGTVLFDCGCHPDAMTDRWPEAQREATPHFETEDQHVLNALARLGYTPDDIDYVVISHLHEDHAGCLEYFKKSKILVHENELASAMVKYATRKDLGAYIYKDMKAWLEADLDWELFPADMEKMELYPGLEILNFHSGHTAGLLGLMMHLKNTGTVIYTSDAINCTDNYNFKYPGICYDSQGFVQCVKYVHRLEKQYNATIWFSHDAKQCHTLTLSDQGYYD